MFEIHYKTITVKRSWHVLPSNTGGVSIRTLVVHEVFCVTGSDDGVLRVWPLDFSTVCMEAGMYICGSKVKFLFMYVKIGIHSHAIRSC